MAQAMEVQVLSSAPLPRRLMVGQQPLELFIVVRIHAGQQNMKLADNNKEFIDVVDENDNVIGSELKGSVHEQELWHREIGVIIFNANGEILLQRRSMKKHYFAGLWSITCTGHVHKGKSPIDAAHQELKEELGFDTDLYFLERKKMIYENNKSFGYVYAGRVENDVCLKIDKSELEEAKFYKKIGYLKLLDNGKVERFSVENLEKVRRGFFTDWIWS